ncbi:MAG: class II aldolase/adducin family protein [Actinomycetes bacterium]|jgi:L-fuculose-phosphate aldolase
MGQSEATHSPTSLSDALVDMARSQRILELEGHGDMSLGHMSFRDPDGRGAWLKRGNLGFEEVTANDFILIDFDGKILEGDGIRHLEWPLHTEILLAREDVNFVVHSHPFYSVALSATSSELGPYSNEGVWFEAAGVPNYLQTSNLINTRELGHSLATTLGKSEAMLLRNHGAAFVGSTVEEATLAGVFLEKASKMQVTLLSMGLPFTAPDSQEMYEKRLTIYPDRAKKNFWDYYNRKLDRSEGNEQQAKFQQ